MERKRSERQDVLCEIIRSEGIKTQRKLVERLRERGFDCTQATVSRDIAILGLEKAPEGVYMLPEDLRLQRIVRDLVVDVKRAGNLVVIHSTSGAAQGVAAALDAAELPEVLGSVAGDDTIIAIASDVAGGENFERMLNHLRGVL